MKKVIDKTLIKDNFYVTKYFLNTKKVLEDNNVNHVATLQFKTDKRISYIACGLTEIIEILETYLDKTQLSKLTIKYAKEGSVIEPNQCILSISGDYKIFCIFENIFDSILARRCSVATNCAQILDLLKDQQKVIFMSDRSDDYRLEPYDGYSAYVAGIRQFSNQSHISLIDNQNEVSLFGSMPHALIHQFHGDIVETFKAYQKVFPNNVVMLIDFNNDVMHELELLTPYFKDISGVRLDTSINMIDKSLKNEFNDNNDYGVNDKLVRMVRNYLDSHDGKHIKIICSSNNNYETIKNFENLKTPIDYYGIGSYLTHLSLHFTADLVSLDNKEFAKAGRKALDESHLITYKK